MSLERIVVGIESSRGGAIVVVSRGRGGELGGWVDEALLYLQEVAADISSAGAEFRLRLVDRGNKLL